MGLKARKLTGRTYNVKYGGEDKLNRWLKKNPREERMAKEKSMIAATR